MAVSSSVSVRKGLPWGDLFFRIWCDLIVKITCFKHRNLTQCSRLYLLESAVEWWYLEAGVKWTRCVNRWHSWTRFAFGGIPEQDFNGIS